MKCVSYNIQYGLGADGVYDLPRIAGDVADADVIALQEVDRFWARSGLVDSPAVLSEHLPDHYWVYGANLDMGANALLAVKCCLDNRRWANFLDWRACRVAAA